MTQHDRQLMESALESLDRAGCQGWACCGPTLRPKHMITCHLCSTMAQIAKRLGVYIPVKQRTGKDESKRK